MEGDGTVVRQDELMRWQEPSTPGGAHSRAWAVLNNNRSQFIARNLGIGDPAKAQMCLGCHSTAGTARAVPAEDGVGCESCHGPAGGWRSEEHTSELQSLMRISYAVFCLKKKKNERETDRYQQ